MKKKATKRKKSLKKDPRKKDIAALSALNAQFIRNFVNNDAKAHAEIIYKDFVCIENNGDIVGREKYLQEWAHGYDPNVFVSFRHDDEFIRFFGGGKVALVRSKTYYQKRVNGQIVNGNTVYTDTYIKEKGRWWCIQAQITPVQE